MTNAERTPSDRSLTDLFAEEARLSRQILAARMADGTEETLTAEVYLAAMAIRAAIAHAMTWGYQADVREAIEAGATWQQIAAARAVSVDEARSDFRRWIRAQAALWDSGPTPSGARFGLGPKARTVIAALADRC